MGRPRLRIAGIVCQIIERCVGDGGAGEGEALETRNDRTGRIGAVSRSRNQAEVPMRLALGLVIASNGEQAGKFTLAPCIRL